MWLAMLVSLAGAAVTIAGVVAARRWEAWAGQNKTKFIAFAAGVLVAVSLLHLVPESFARTGAAATGLFGGYALLLLLDRLVTSRVCSDAADAGRAIGLVALVGIGLHSLLDGVAYAVGFNVGAITGLLMAAGMVLHEFPEGIVTYTLLVVSGYPARRAWMLTLLAAALSTPLGTLMSWPVVDRLDATRLGLLLAVSAGALLYVGATHLMPRAADRRDPAAMLALAAGAATGAGLTLFAG